MQDQIDVLEYIIFQNSSRIQFNFGWEYADNFADWQRSFDWDDRFQEK